MRTILFLIALSWTFPAYAEDVAKTEKVVLIVHGGTADLQDRREMTPALEKRYRAGLEAAAKAGYARLKQRATSLDAVEAAVRVLEDDGMFDAGKGSFFTHEGKNELDASIMDGKTMKAGAVATVTTIKNPISAARAVMEKTKHVLLVAKGAEKFAANAGIEIVDPSYFYTERSWQELQRALQEEKTKKTSSFANPRPGHWGTVGAVALDFSGNLAAGASTGGRTNKLPGRVGDSPIIGAGTYADNEGVAIACTGNGEFFIRYSAAHDVNALYKYKGFGIQKAADTVIQEKLKPVGGEGAMIGLDAKGHPAISSNSEGIFHAWVTESGKITIGIFTKE